MTREPVSEHYDSGPHGPRVRAVMRRRLSRVRFGLDHRLTSSRMSDYIDDELGRAFRRRLIHHLSECHECRELLASLRQLVAVLRGAAVANADEPAPPLAAAVLARLDEPA
jgi:Putative zinc-finger